MKDGPYIYYKDQNDYLQVDIDENGFVNRKHLNGNIKSITCHVDNDAQDTFTFDLRDDHEKMIKAPSKVSEKLLVISDIEGNFNAMQGLLLANGVIDKNHDWIYGKGQLILCGDMVDRGKNVIPVLWLIYKLETQAHEAGGHVYFLYGNHEELLISGSTKYVHPKYKYSASSIIAKENPKEAFRELLAYPFVLRDWLLQKDSIVKIADVLFVHAGISSKLIEKGFTIDEINKLIRKGISRTPVRPVTLIPKIAFLFGGNGPLWYRGMVMDYKDKYKKMEEEELKKILAYFDVNHIVLGHSLVAEVSSDFKRKVFRIDVGHPTEKSTGMSQGLLISSNKFYRVNDLGEQFLI